jgi:hypothetical protein
MNNKTKEKHDIDEFEEYAHLWNIVPGGKGEGVVLLRKIIDSIHYGSFSEPLVKTPIFLLVGAKGTGKGLIARAIANSLAIEDVRICPAIYFENGMYSHQFFNASTSNTAHIVTDIENLRGTAEATLFKYLKNRECKYYNHIDRDYSNILCCNGWIILTCKETKTINDALLGAIDHVIKIELLNRDQVMSVLHQKLVFIGCDYEGSEEVLNAIVNAGQVKIDLTMDFLKKCLMLKAGLSDVLDMEIVNRTKRMCGMPVDFEDTIPF